MSVSFWQNVVLMTQKRLSVFWKNSAYVCLKICPWTDIVSTTAVQDAVTKLYGVCVVEIKMKAEFESILSQKYKQLEYILLDMMMEDS